MKAGNIPSCLVGLMSFEIAIARRTGRLSVKNFSYLKLNASENRRIFH